MRNRVVSFICRWKHCLYWIMNLEKYPVFFIIMTYCLSDIIHFDKFLCGKWFSNTKHRRYSNDCCLKYHDKTVIRAHFESSPCLLRVFPQIRRLYEQLGNFVSLSRWYQNHVLKLSFSFSSNFSNRINENEWWCQVTYISGAVPGVADLPQCSTYN